jgi:hypothetical protein
MQVTQAECFPEMLDTLSQKRTAGTLLLKDG